MAQALFLEDWRVLPTVTRPSTYQNAPILHFPLESIGVRTPFRAWVLNRIYQLAEELTHRRLESARVSVWTDSDEEGPVTFVLTLLVDAAWETCDLLAQQILQRISEEAADWSMEDKEDYREHIYFTLGPLTP